MIPPDLTPAERAVLAALTEAARSGARCPTNPELVPVVLKATGGNVCATPAVERLWKRGLIRSEIYGSNWRVVEVFGVGRTAEAPTGGRPWRVNGVVL